MNTLTNKKTGDTVTVSKAGRGQALVTSRSADGIVTSCTVTVNEARRHFAGLFEAGWR